METKKEKRTIAGIPLVLYAIVFAVIVIAYGMGKAPNNYLTGFGFCMVIGFVLDKLGRSNKYLNMLGGASLMCLFVPSILVYFGLIPENIVEATDEFYTGSMGFIDFFVASLLTGSLLSMDRKILVEAGKRYAVPLLMGVVFAFGCAGLIGAVSGYGFSAAILNLAIPIMGGGIGAGAIPIASVYEGYGYSVAGGDILSMLMPAVTLANIVAILTAAILNAIANTGKMPAGFNGNGKLMRTGPVYEVKEDQVKKGATFESLGIGLLCACGIYSFGYLCSKVLFVNVPGLNKIHAYAYAILTAAVLKILGVLPKKIEDGAGEWYQLVSYIGVPTILVCIGITAMDLNTIFASISNPVYLLITVVVTVAAAIGAGLGGLIMKMFFVESGITAGLCMANAGGAGDVAVLGAAGRMNLMPFAQISSRIGGALILLIASFLTPLLL